MNQADTAYHDLVEEIYDHGERHENRTGVDTRRIWGHMARFDLQKGFPLLTSKKMAVKTAFTELLGFVRGETDVRWYQERGCKIWDADHERWHGKDLERDKARLIECRDPAESARLAESIRFRERNHHSLGLMYGYNWLHLEAGNDLIRMPKPTLPGPEAHPLDPCIEVEPVAPDAAVVEHPEWGRYWCTRTGVSDAEGRPIVRVVFPATGYVCHIRKDQADRGSVKDRFAVSCAGVGRLGLPVEGPHAGALHKIWSHMLARCYNPDCKEYVSYGAKGIVVCDRWHRFDYFAQDVQELPGYTAWRADHTRYQLDKDYLAATYYGPSSCVWIPSSHNKSYRSRGIEGTAPDGSVHYHVSACQLAEQHDLQASKISLVANGERPHHKGWTFRWLVDELVRYPLPYNQLGEIIKALKAGSNSRRLIMSAWAPHRFHMMSLPPCHVTYHFVKRGEFLDIAMWQRSVDCGLGLGFNWANTALLCHLVAAPCGLKPGQMVWFGDDVHVYEPHLEALYDQVHREPRPTPSIMINREPETMPWDINPEDISVLNYDPHPRVKLDLFVG